MPLAIWSQTKVGMEAWAPFERVVADACDRNVVSSSGAVSPATRATASMTPVMMPPMAVGSTIRRSSSTSGPRA